MSVSEPGKIITPWAESGLKNPIPPAANPATGRAGFDQGFSAINMTAREAGGFAPFGQDFNGIFYEVTNILRYMQAGGQPTFDAALATAIGGYPKGAMVLGGDGLTLWQSQIESNSVDPDINPSNWGTFDIGLKAQLAAPAGPIDFSRPGLRDIISIKDFGAKGDGLTDDTNAILAAFSLARSIGGRVKIEFVHGATYIVRGTQLIVDFPNVILEGHKTKLKLIDSPTVIQGPILRIASYGNLAVRGTVENVVVRGFELDGNKLNQVQTMNNGGDANNPGFVSEDVHNLWVEDVISHDCDGYGFLFAGSYLPHRKGAYFKNCYAYGNNVDGFDVKAGFNHVTLDSCRSWDNGYAPMVELRSGMGIDLRGRNVTLINCVVGEEGPNYAGNFRVRQNAESGFTFLGCHSYNSPDGTYGYMMIGGNNTNMSLVGCTSTNDGTSLKHERGHVSLTGFKSWKPKLLSFLQSPSQFAAGTLTVAATFTAIGQTITLTPSDSLLATIGSEMKLPTSTGTVYLLVTDTVGGVWKCTVLRGNLGTASVGAKFTALSAGSLTVNGGISYQSALDAMQFASTLQDLADSPMPVTFTGFIVEAPARYGVNFQGGQVNFYGGAIRNCGKGAAAPGFLVGNEATAASSFNLNGVFIGNDDSEATQAYALQFQSPSLASGVVSNCKLGGNAAGVVAGAPSVSVKFSNNAGYVTQATPSTTIDVTAVGIKTFSVPHSLNKAPAAKDVVLTVQRSGAANDYALSSPIITGVSATKVSGRVYVLTASATPAETATIYAHIDVI